MQPASAGLVSSQPLGHDIEQTNLRASQGQVIYSAIQGSPVNFLVDLENLSDNEKDYDNIITYNDFEKYSVRSAVMSPHGTDTASHTFGFNNVGTYKIVSYLLYGSSNLPKDNESLKQFVNTANKDAWPPISINFRVTAAPTPPPEPDTITVSTDKTNYNTGEMIRVSGQTNKGFTHGTVFLKGPLGNLLVIEPFNSRAYGSFEMVLDISWFVLKP